MTEKKCKDCKYFRPDFWMRTPSTYTHCAHPKTTKIDLIIGKPVYEYARDQRALGGPCGPTGDLFEREASALKRRCRGRGAFAFGVLYVGLFGAFLYRLRT